MRVAVLSDLHVHRVAEPDSWSLAKAAFRAAARFDHVIVAGDLFDSASAFEDDAEALRRQLRRERLWSSDRLTITVGNHDIFHTPHRGTVVERGVEMARAFTADANESYEGFCDWAGEVVRSRSRLTDDDLFPFVKELDGVRLLVNDTTGFDTAHSCNGYWRPEEDALLRDADLAGGRRLLVVHHPPYEEAEATWKMKLRQDFAFGFPRPHFRRLQAFADHARLDAVVCGHIHAGPDAWAWRLGRGTRVWMAGRTGGMHDETPSFGDLRVPTRGRLTWRTIRV
jgi:predicted phosphodiesterase